MIDNSAVADIVEAARRAGLDQRTVREIERIVHLAQAEAELRGSFPERLTRVERLATQTLGEENGWNWLRRYNRLLGAVPIDVVMEGEEGASRVETVLGRIEHGLYT